MNASYICCRYSNGSNDPQGGWERLSESQNMYDISSDCRINSTHV